MLRVNYGLYSLLIRIFHVKNNAREMNFELEVTRTKKNNMIDLYDKFI